MAFVIKQKEMMIEDFNMIMKNYNAGIYILIVLFHESCNLNVLVLFLTFCFIRT